MPIINTTPAVVGGIIKEISGTQGSDQVVKDIQVQGHKLIFTYGDSGRINIINVDGTPLPIDPTSKSVDIDLSGKADVFTTTESGVGNAITSVTYNNDLLTFDKGITFSVDGHNHDERYYTQTQIDNILPQVLAQKVDKIDGMGLSTNDYTDADKDKLTNLATVATTGSYDDLTDKPPIPVIPNISVTDTQSGNAVTDVTASGHTITLTRGKTFSEAGHTHAISDVTNLQSSLNGKLDDSQLITALSSTASDEKIMSEKLVRTELGKKVTAESGKGLSTNDYTTADKNKLAGIAAGAEVNVQSDWSATEGDAFIKNKPTALSSFTNDSGFITKAVNDLTNYYTKSNTYTKTEVNNLISTHLTLSVVSALPTSNISTTTIYLVPGSDSATSNAYDEYVYTNNTWEKIGTTVTDLTPYAKTADVNTALGGKVDKLSTSPAGNGFVKVNVNAQGQVTGHSAMAESDIPTLSISKIDGLQGALNGKAATFSVTDSNPALAWGTKSKVATVAGTDIHVTMPANPNTDTDTKNTAGSTNSASKLFLIGATSQAANPQTYSNSKVYETDGALVATTIDATQVGGLTKTYTTGANTTRVILARVNNYTGLASCRIKLEIGPDTSSGAKVAYLDAVWAGRGARLVIESVYDWNNAVRYFFITCPNNTSYYTSYPPEIHIQQNSAVARTIKATIIEKSGDVVLLDNLTTAGVTTNRNSYTYDVNNTVGLFDNAGYINTSGWSNGTWDRIDNDRYRISATKVFVNGSTNRGVRGGKLAGMGSNGYLYHIATPGMSFQLPFIGGRTAGDFDINSTWGRVSCTIRGIGTAEFTNLLVCNTEALTAGATYTGISKCYATQYRFNVPGETEVTTLTAGENVYVVGNLDLDGNFVPYYTMQTGQTIAVPKGQGGFTANTNCVMHKYTFYLTQTPAYNENYNTFLFIGRSDQSTTQFSYLCLNAHAYTYNEWGTITHIDGKRVAPDELECSNVMTGISMRLHQYTGPGVTDISPSMIQVGDGQYLTNLLYPHYLEIRDSSGNCKVTLGLNAVDFKDPGLHIISSNSDTADISPYKISSEGFYVSNGGVKCTDIQFWTSTSNGYSTSGSYMNPEEIKVQNNFTDTYAYINQNGVISACNRVNGSYTYTNIDGGTIYADTISLSSWFAAATINELTLSNNATYFSISGGSSTTRTLTVDSNFTTSTAVTTTGTITQNQIPLFNANSSGVLKQSGVTIATSLTSNSDANVPTSKAVATYVTNLGYKKITASTSAPTSSDGANGDIWIQY